METGLVHEKNERFNMDFDLTVLEQGGISVKDGLGYTGNTEKYVSALQRFYKNYESNSNGVKEYLAAGDIDNFTVKVHALKSNSRMIGAEALAALFEELELCGKSGNRAAIEEKTPEALKMYERIVEVIRPFGEMERVKAPGELSADEAKAVADELLKTLDDFDDEGSIALATKLSGYPFRITQKNRLREAIDLIGDFMYDEAAEIVNELIPFIE